MKRLVLTALLLMGMGLWTACPPQSTPLHVIVVTWTNTGYAPTVHYEIYKSIDGTTFTLATTQPLSVTTWVDASGVIGHTYWYYMVAYDPTTGLTSPPTVTKNQVVP